MEQNAMLSTLGPSAIIAGGLASATSKGVRGWLAYDFTITLLCGVSMFVTPQFLLAIQTDVSLDQISLHLGRLVGLLLMASSYNIHHAISAQRVVEQLAVIRSRFVSAILILVVAVYANSHYHEWNVRHVEITIVGAAVWIVMYGYYGVSLHNRHSHSYGSSADLFLMIDHTATLFAGAFWLAFPQWVLRNLATIQPNAVSVHIGRVCGALLIGLSMLSEFSTRFTTRQGKNNIIISRMLVAGALLFLVIYAQLTEKFNAIHLFLGTTAALCWETNAFFAYIAVNYTRSSASSPSFAQSGSSQMQSEVRTHGEGFTVSRPKVTSVPSFDITRSYEGREIHVRDAQAQNEGANLWIK